MMRVVETIDELNQGLGDAPRSFVPTMGALHEGHLALIRKASDLPGAGAVVVSIFVNPTQFAPGEDFERYPRTFKRDLKAAEEAGADVVFAPSVETVYPPDEPPGVPPLPAVATEPQLEDAHRPGHFAGVCQVVARLFDIVRPTAAVFGEKDYQQLLVIRALARQQGDRWPGLKIVAGETIRKPDGLAMSSRNAYLSPEQRQRALAITRSLEAAAKAEPLDDLQPIEAMMRKALEQAQLAVDYAVVRDAETLMPVTDPTRPRRALIAARVPAIDGANDVRLIDNRAIPQPS